MFIGILYRIKIYCFSVYDTCTWFLMGIKLFETVYNKKKFEKNFYAPNSFTRSSI